MPFVSNSCHLFELTRQGFPEGYQPSSPDIWQMVMENDHSWDLGLCRTNSRMVVHTEPGLASATGERDCRSGPVHIISWSTRTLL